MSEHDGESNLPTRSYEHCSLAPDASTPAGIRFSVLDAWPSPARTCLAVMLRRKRTLITAVAVVVVATCLLTALSARVYEATATILVSEPAGKVPGGRGGQDQLQLMMTAWSAPDIETHATLLEGRSTAAATSAWLEEHGGPRLSAPEVEHSIRASVVPRTRLIRVSARTSSSENARRLANAAVRAYAETNRSRAQGSAESASEYLGEQLVIAKGNVKSAEEALRDFRESTGTVAPDASAGELLARAASLTADIDKTRADRVQAAQRLREIRGQLAEQNKSIAASHVRDNGVIKQLRAKLVELEGKRLLLESQYTGSFSAPVDQIDEQIRITTAQLNAEIQRVVRGKGGDLAMQQELVGQLIQGEAETAALRAREQQLEREVAATEEELKKIPARQIALARLQRQVDIAQGIHSDLLRRAQELEVGRVMAFGNTEIVELADAPLLPIKPNVPVNLSIGMLLGLAVGIGLVLLQEQFDDRVTDEAEVALFTEAPILGTVPSFEGTGPTAALPSLTLREGAADAYSSLRVNLGFVTPGAGGKIVLVTSAAPQEGKTTTAVNLAMVAAESGRRVVLLDSDLRNPSMHRVLGIGGGKGLSDLLAGQAGLPDVARRFDGVSLSLIGAGTIPPNPTDLLDSQEMRSLVELLRKEADIVILDSPPLLLAADSLVLAGLSDVVLMVCEPGTSHGRALHRARLLLNQIGRRISGVVLNKTAPGSSYYYPYEYHYERRVQPRRENCV